MFRLLGTVFHSHKMNMMNYSNTASRTMYSWIATCTAMKPWSPFSNLLDRWMVFWTQSNWLAASSSVSVERLKILGGVHGEGEMGLSDTGVRMSDLFSRLGEHSSIRNEHYSTGWWFGTLFMTFHILGISIPTDFHIFQRGRYTTN